jgi:hypothetical protein
VGIGGAKKSVRSVCMGLPGDPTPAQNLIAQKSGYNEGAKQRTGM